MSQELTDEWLECYYETKAQGKNPADSIFFRLAPDFLPLGVDETDPRVQEVISELRRLISQREGSPSEG